MKRFIETQTKEEIEVNMDKVFTIRRGKDGLILDFKQPDMLVVKEVERDRMAALLAMAIIGLMTAILVIAFL